MISQVALPLVFTALTAFYIPVRRALRIDHMMALHNE
jgi:hypothetical protein